MTRSEIINSLIEKHNYKSYLEIGVNTPAQPGYNWPQIKVDLKHGVDPEVETTFKMTSDEFFEKHISQKYDFIFVDGLHIFEQCYRDIINSLNHLNDNGTIMAHDTSPSSEIAQRPVRESGNWNGDVWKAILKLRLENENLEIVTVDTDEGCSLIRRGKQKLLNPKADVNSEDLYNYEVFQHNRLKILNMISVSEFKEKFLS
jgi:hypothetical protein